MRSRRRCKPRFSSATRVCVCQTATDQQAVPCSEHSKILNEMRLKVLTAREAAIQEVISEARAKLKEVSKNPTAYKKLLIDLIVQV